MNYDYILFEQQQQIATIWFNRPEKHNALNGKLIREITHVFRKVNEIDEIRVVLLRGKGKSFCAGADINRMKEISDFGHRQNIAEAQELADCFEAIYTCQKPTIAVVHGAAYGGANGLLAAADFAFAESQTFFAFSEVKLGIVPATISPYVIKRIGEFAARDLMLTGRRFGAPEAQQLRLVNRQLPGEQLEPAVNETIKQLLSSKAEAVVKCKQLIFDVCNVLPNGSVKEYSVKLIADIRATDEAKKGLADFLENRKGN